MAFSSFLQQLQFSDAENIFWAEANSPLDFLTPKWTPKVVHKLLNMGLKRGTFDGQVVRISGLAWGPIREPFGAKKGEEAPRWIQEGHQEPQSTEKQHLQKVIFSNAETILFEFWRLPRRA